ncbi:MAG: hypothetical protein ABIE36_00640 [Candidatus Diapherotrites archaeon]
MKHNNKGLSTIVATLIIILLVLVATGIIWVVVRNVVQGGSEDIEINAKCLDSLISATNVVSYGDNGTHTLVGVTLSRTGGNEVIGGVSLIFTDAEESGSVTANIPENIVNSAVITRNVTIEFLNATKVTPVVYFKDSSGNNQFCQASTPREF